MPAVPCARVQSGHDMCSVGAHTHASHARHVEKPEGGSTMWYPCPLSDPCVLHTCHKLTHHANPPPLTQLKSQHAPRPAFTSTPCSWHELHGCRTPSCEKISVLRSHDDAEQQRKIHPQKTSAPWPASSGRWLFGPAKVILDPGRMEAFFSCAYRLPAACNTVRVKLVCTTKVESL